MNNLMQLRYAIEVEKTGSISKAAENLFMAQPHLSKAIRELEDSLQITIFNRNSKGVVPTKRGAEFLYHARAILSKVDEMEAIFSGKANDAHRIDVCVPRASYIAQAFINFTKDLSATKKILLNYKEANSIDTISGVSDSLYNLGIIRYPLVYEKQYLNLLNENDLRSDLLFEFNATILLSKKHPFADRSSLSKEDLQELLEITHGDITTPSLPSLTSKQYAATVSLEHSISIYERASQLELLSSVPNTYMLVSPMPQDILDRYELTTVSCNQADNRFCDVLIYRNGYRFNNEDTAFINKVKLTIDSLVIGHEPLDSL